MCFQGRAGNGFRPRQKVSIPRNGCIAFPRDVGKGARDGRRTGPDRAGPGLTSCSCCLAGKLEQRWIVDDPQSIPLHPADCQSNLTTRRKQDLSLFFLFFWRTPLPPQPPPAHISVHAVSKRVNECTYLLHEQELCPSGGEAREFTLCLARFFFFLNRGSFFFFFQAVPSRIRKPCHNDVSLINFFLDKHISKHVACQKKVVVEEEIKNNKFPDNFVIEIVRYTDSSTQRLLFCRAPKKLQKFSVFQRCFVMFVPLVTKSTPRKNFVQQVQTESLSCNDWSSLSAKDIPSESSKERQGEGGGRK